MTGVWARIMKNHRIVKQLTVECAHSDAEEALREICHRLDLEKPMWLDKNQREWDEFNQTYFTQAHFLEEISFDRLELEYIDPQSKKERPRDPRIEA